MNKMGSHPVSGSVGLFVFVLEGVGRCTTRMGKGRRVSHERPVAWKRGEGRGVGPVNDRGHIQIVQNPSTSLSTKIVNIATVNGCRCRIQHSRQVTELRSANKYSRQVSGCLTMFCHLELVVLK